MHELEWKPSPAPANELGWGWRDLLLAIFCFFAVTGIAAIVIGTIAAWRGISTTESTFTAPTIYATAFTAYLAMAGSVLVFALRRGTPAQLGLHLPAFRELLIVPPIFFLGITALVAVNLTIAAFNGGTFENPQAEGIAGSTPLTRTQFVALLILIAGLVPLAEELLFRGMLYPLLRQRFRPLVAVPLNAALFSIAHVIPIILPGLFVVGLFIAYLRERSNSIWPCVLYHMLQNSLALFAIDAALRTGAL